MADRSRIDRGLYWSKSWRVVSGCEKVSPGCAHCWSERETVMRGKNPNKKIAERYGGGECTTGGKWNGQVRLAPERVLTEPLRVKKPQMWAAWNDLFHKDVPFECQRQVFRTMALTPQHTYIVLTKRPERFFSDRNLLQRLWNWSTVCSKEFSSIDDQLREMVVNHPPLPNVIGMVTVENQDAADERIPWLLRAPFVRRGISIEPMLSSVNIKMALARGIGKIDWVICGGESGPKARPMAEEWARGIIRQCREAGVPVFVKQIHRMTLSGGLRVSKDMAEWPEDLRVREFPK